MVYLQPPKPQHIMTDARMTLGRKTHKTEQVLATIPSDQVLQKMSDSPNLERKQKNMPKLEDPSWSNNT